MILILLPSITAESVESQPNTPAQTLEPQQRPTGTNITSHTFSDLLTIDWTDQAQTQPQTPSNYFHNPPLNQ